MSGPARLLAGRVAVTSFPTATCRDKPTFPQKLRLQVQSPQDGGPVCFCRLLSSCSVRLPWQTVREKQRGRRWTATNAVGLVLRSCSSSIQSYCHLVCMQDGYTVFHCGLVQSPQAPSPCLSPCQLWLARSIRRGWKAFGEEQRTGRQIGQRVGLEAVSGGRPCTVIAVLDKTQGVNENGSGPVEPARLALERLYIQAQHCEDRFARTRFMGQEAEIHNVVSELEGDLTVALEALRTRENELSAAEAAIRTDQRLLSDARSALVAREKQLESSEREHIRQKEELHQSQCQLKFHKEEVERIRVMLWEREAEIRSAQQQVAWKQEEIDRTRVRLMDREKAMESVQEELQMKEKQLARVNVELASAAAQIDKLRNEVDVREREFAATNKELEMKAAKLQETEEELKLRSAAWLAAQNEFKELEKVLEKEKTDRNRERNELQRTCRLLAEVRSELNLSRHLVVKVRKELNGQGALMKQRDGELMRQRSLLRKKDKELTQLRIELAQERGHLQLARDQIAAQNDELQEKQVGIELVQAELDRERKMLREAVAELQELKNELRRRDAALSEAQLAVQIREAELITVKLELQQLRVEAVASKLAMKKKEEEVKKAWAMVTNLQAELVVVKTKLQQQEGELQRVNGMLQATQEELHFVRRDLNEHKTQLLEARSALKHMSHLSKRLVESALQDEERDGKAVTSESAEDSLLVQQSAELHSARRAVIQKGMEVEELREREKRRERENQEVVSRLAEAEDLVLEREVELAGARVQVTQREEETLQIVKQWQKREEDLEREREEVASTAKELVEKHEAVLTALSMSSKPFHQQLDKQDDETETSERQKWTASALFDVEIARHEVEVAMNMLQEIAQSSEGVKRLMPSAVEAGRQRSGNSLPPTMGKHSEREGVNGQSHQEGEAVGAKRKVNGKKKQERERSVIVQSGGRRSYALSNNTNRIRQDWNSNQIQDQEKNIYHTRKGEGIKLSALAIGTVNRLAKKLIRESDADLHAPM